MTGKAFLHAALNEGPTRRQFSGTGRPLKNVLVEFFDRVFAFVDVRFGKAQSLGHTGGHLHREF
ncbi:MAG TPA: hypothetical protein PK648_04715, partial [Verrucomicrobiales bacterium]|nr:hypothetical protein [Verrucomicrobiales bacterium]